MKGLFEMYPDDDFLPDEAFDEITKGEYEDMMEDHNINSVLNRFVRLCQEYGFYFMMRQLTKALNAKGFNV
jgi:hypothetical protein